MNIFVLDRNVKKCAVYYANRHVVKMITEYAQLLCTALNCSGIKSHYPSTHVHGRYAKWTRASLSNWRWLRELALALHEEWRYRYDHSKDEYHKAAKVILELPEPPIEDLGLTPFAVPVGYEHYEDAVTAYRNYYNNEKTWATWKKRNTPHWYEPKF